MWYWMFACSLPFFYSLAANLACIAWSVYVCLFVCLVFFFSFFLNRLRKATLPCDRYFKLRFFLFYVFARLMHAVCVLIMGWNVRWKAPHGSGVCLRCEVLQHKERCFVMLCTRVHLLSCFLFLWCFVLLFFVCITFTFIIQRHGFLCLFCFITRKVLFIIICVFGDVRVSDVSLCIGVRVCLCMCCFVIHLCH